MDEQTVVFKVEYMLGGTNTRQLFYMLRERRDLEIETWDLVFYQVAKGVYVHHGLRRAMARAVIVKPERFR